MASQRSSDDPSGNETPDLPNKTPARIKLRVENLLGRRLDLLAPANSTVRMVKEALEALHGLSVEKQSLVRCGSGDRSGRYTRLEDQKALEEYGIMNDERLLLIRAVRTGPVSEDSRNVKTFIENNNQTVAAAIDRLLKQRGRERKPGYHYVLAQMDGQRPGDYTILEIPLSRPDPEPSKAEEGKQPVDRVLTSVERKQNLKTQEKMKRLRESIELQKKNRKKQTATTSVASIGKPCGSCGTMSAERECPKCAHVYCPKHANAHACP